MEVPVDVTVWVATIDVGVAVLVTVGMTGEGVVVKSPTVTLPFSQVA